MMKSHSSQTNDVDSDVGSPAVTTPRTCKGCGATKSASDYYLQNGRSYGQCKECVKARVHRRYAENRGEIAAYERVRSQRPERRAKAAEYQKRRCTSDSRRAHIAVGNALRRGRLVRQACEVCGTTTRVQAHHDDYGKPLSVRWLCFTHHREHGHGQVVLAREGLKLAA
jgi:hypothetical protein